jgi:ammonia channel protein AmtB
MPRPARKTPPATGCGCLGGLVGLTAAAVAVLVVGPVLVGLYAGLIGLAVLVKLCKAAGD